MLSDIPSLHFVRLSLPAALKAKLLHAAVSAHRMEHASASAAFESARIRSVDLMVNPAAGPTYPSLKHANEHAAGAAV